MPKGRIFGQSVVSFQSRLAGYQLNNNIAREKYERVAMKNNFDRTLVSLMVISSFFFK